MSKRLTPNQKAWEKEIARIERFMKKASRRGYVFNEYIIPARPARITKKRLSALKSMRGMKLYEQSRYYTPTGAIIPGSSGPAYEKALKSQISKTKIKKYPTEAQIVRDNLKKLLARFSSFAELMDLIDSWSPKSGWSEEFTRLKREDKDKAKNIINGQIREQGAEVIARRVQEHADEIIDLVWYIIYGASGKEKDNGDYMQSQITHLATLLKGGSLTPEEARNLHDIAEGETV